MIEKTRSVDKIQVSSDVIDELIEDEKISMLQYELWGLWDEIDEYFTKAYNNYE